MKKNEMNNNQIDRITFKRYKIFSFLIINWYDYSM